MGTKMIAAALDRVIRAMCAEVDTLKEHLDWRTINEAELLFEAAVCIVGSQTVYEMALGIAQRLKEGGFLEPSAPPSTNWKRGLAATLNAPIQFFANGRSHTSKPRFKNRIAYLLSATLTNVYGRKSSFRKILSGAKGPEDARRVLVSTVFGFGPKQASLFLRRVGFSSDLAVIDTHILDYMRICAGVSTNPTALSKIGRYEQIEAAFKILAREIGYDVGCVDLAAWITMRVAKREAYL